MLLCFELVVRRASLSVVCCLLRVVDCVLVAACRASVVAVCCLFGVVRRVVSGVRSSLSVVR